MQVDYFSVSSFIMSMLQLSARWINEHEVHWPLYDKYRVNPLALRAIKCHTVTCFYSILDTVPKNWLFTKWTTYKNVDINTYTQAVQYGEKPPGDLKPKSNSTNPNGSLPNDFNGLCIKPLLMEWIRTLSFENVASVTVIWLCNKYQKHHCHDDN